MFKSQRRVIWKHIEWIQQFLELGYLNPTGGKKKRLLTILQ